MQGWLFLTFIMVGSLLGVTGLRQFFIDPLHNHVEHRVVFCTGAAAVAVPSQCSARTTQRHVLSLSCEHTVFHSRRAERIRSNAVLLGGC